MTTRIKLRRDTAANWATTNPILAAGEPGFETDTGKIKYGDGITAFADLTYSGGTVNNSIKGFINLVGDRPNDEDDIWFEAVTVHGDYAYAVGSDYYIAGSNNATKVYKFDLNTGAQVWVKQLTSGRGATFDFSFSGGVATLEAVAQGGAGYSAGDTLFFNGNNWEANANLNRLTVTVDTVDYSGAVLTASIVAGYNVDGVSGNSNNISSDNDGAEGDTVSVAYNATTDQLAVVSEYNTGLGDDMDYNWTWFNIYTVNATTGLLAAVTTTVGDNADVYPNSVKIKDGNIAIVGEKYGEYRQFGTLNMLGTGVGYFDILKSNLDPEHIPGTDFNNQYDFWVEGTGISNMENIDNLNVYDAVSSTVRQGSGAEFSITDNGDTTYTLTAITLGGANYLPGHKIKVLGAILNGANDVNDAIITVTSVDAGSITGASITGTAASANGVANFTNVTGTNFETGSSALFIIGVDQTTGTCYYYGQNNYGVKYVVGDVLTVPGTVFANGTSPANDVTFTVSDLIGDGSVVGILNNTISGTAPTDALRINVNGVDFTTGGGSWTMKQNLGGEAFIWTSDFSNSIGGPSGDRFYDVCWSGDCASLYAVGKGVYEVNYNQAIVVKFNATTGAVIWSQDIKFDEASTENREARAVVEVPGSTDIIVAGGWWNPESYNDEPILTRMTSAGEAVWQKIYTSPQGYSIDFEMNLSASGNTVVLSLEQQTNNNRGLGYFVINPETGAVITHRVLSSDGNSNYNYYNTPTPQFAAVTTDSVVFAGYTYVPTDNYQNALLVRLPLDGYKDMAYEHRMSLSEHMLTRHEWTPVAVTPSFVAFTVTPHLDTLNTATSAKSFEMVDPQGLLQVWTFKVTDDAAGYLEFGDGSKQAFATDIIPQIPAANDYYLTAQDSGKHIYFEYETGRVYIPHWTDVNLPVGFTFTIVNTTGNNIYVETMQSTLGPYDRGNLRLAGRDIQTAFIGIPDSGSGTMVTFLKIKSGYLMENSDGQGFYADQWIVSGPGDVYNDD